MLLGVLQLRCKRDPLVKLTSPRMVAKQVQAFPPRVLRMAHSLASQAAVSYETASLPRWSNC